MILDPVRGQNANFTGAWMVPADEISPLWGLSYRDISLEGYAHHRSQGVTPNLNSPFARQPYGLRRSTGASITTTDLAQPLSSLASRIPVPADQSLAAADDSLNDARMAAEKLDWAGAVRAIAEAGKQIAALEDKLKDSKDPQAADSKWELDQVRERINYALSDAAAIKIISNADRSDLVAGESFTIRADVTHRAAIPATFSKPDLIIPTGWTATKQPDQDKDTTTNFSIALPAGSPTPHTPGDWMFPFPPAMVRARTHVEVEGYGFDFTAPVGSHQASTIAVLNYPLRIVPALSLSAEPEQFVVVEGRQPKQFDVFARVHSFARTPSKVEVGVEVPSDWKSAPAEPVEFTGEGDRLVHLTVTPPVKIPDGKYELKAYAKRGAEKFETSLEPLPSLPTYLWSSPASIPVHAFAIAIPDRLHVGYIASDNDAVPDALRRLNVDVEMLDASAVAFGDLHRFDAIVIGLRAYEFRPTRLHPIGACSITPRAAEHSWCRTSCRACGIRSNPRRFQPRSAQAQELRMKMQK